MAKKWDKNHNVDTVFFIIATLIVNTSTITLILMRIANRGNNDE